MEIRTAAEFDVSAVMKLIGQAKEYLKGLKIDQWQDGYPDEDIILNDIADKNGYVLTDGIVVIGYVCVSFDGDENYAVIEGHWKSEQPYAVIHRVVIDNAYKKKGLSALYLNLPKRCAETKIKI